MYQHFERLMVDARFGCRKAQHKEGKSQLWRALYRNHACNASPQLNACTCTPHVHKKVVTVQYDTPIQRKIIVHVVH